MPRDLRAVSSMEQMLTLNPLKEPVMNALRLALDPHLYPDLIAMVKDYALLSFFMVVGGRGNWESADAAAEVWSHGQWHKVASNASMTGRSIGEERWTWCARPQSERPRSSPTISAASWGFERSYTWDPLHPQSLTVVQHQDLWSSETENRGELGSHLIPRADGSYYAMRRIRISREQVAQTPSESISEQYLPFGRVYSSTELCSLDCRPDGSLALRHLTHVSNDIYDNGKTHVCLGNDLFVFSLDRICFRYIGLDNRWCRLPLSRVLRNYIQPAVDVQRRHIYVIGSSQVAWDRSRLLEEQVAVEIGSSISSRLDDARSCERLVVTDESGSSTSCWWQEMPRMNHDRWGACLTVFESNKLIAIGGFSLKHGHSQSDVECLDLPCEPLDLTDSPKPKRRWTMMPSMHTTREDSLLLCGYCV